MFRPIGLILAQNPEGFVNRVCKFFSSCIRLWMVWRREELLNVKRLTKSFGQLGYESTPVIGQERYSSGKSKSGHYVVKDG
jgi:hypothetical protein